MLNLTNITVVCVTSVRVQESIEALMETAKHGRYNSLKLITHANENGSLPKVPKEIIVEECPRLDYRGYSEYIIYHLYKHINTEFALIINWDGFVTNPEQWDNTFLDYDYIGALWTSNHNYKDKNGNDIFVGNGGFSLRSKKLLEFASKINIPWEPREGKYWQEDAIFSVKNRHIYEQAGFKWAPKTLAAKFSQEYHNETIPENVGVAPFGFHGKIGLENFKSKQ
tara:strand:- start:2895 stop:3569 length:675 start_codon:yes stop_codon:yes gene_type:complete